MRARGPGDVGLDAIERAPVGVDAIEDDMAVESAIVARADTPASAGLPNREGLQAQGLAFQVAFAADVGPASGEVGARDQAARQRRRSAPRAIRRSRRREQWRERVEARRVDDDAPVVVARAARRHRSFEPNVVASGQHVERWSGATVAVDVSRLALERESGEKAVDDRQLRAAGRRCDHGIGAPCGVRRCQAQIEVALGVEAIRAPAEQRIGAAGPPRRRIEACQLEPAGGAPRLVRAPARQAAVELRGGVAERRLAAAQLDVVGARSRLDANPRRLRRGARQAAICQLAGEIRDDVDACGRGR
jgi:hypothetical protein